MYSLAVVGSRTFQCKKEMFKILDDYIFNYFWDDGLTETFEIVSGGANGADFLAKEYTIARAIKYKEFPADWNVYGKAAGFKRNTEIAIYSNACFAFIDKPLKNSRGTTDTVSKFLNLSKPIVVYEICHISSGIPRTTLLTFKTPKEIKGLLT